MTIKLPDLVGQNNTMKNVIGIYHNDVNGNPTWSQKDGNGRVVFNKAKGVYEIRSGDLAPRHAGIQSGVIRLIGRPNGFHNPGFTLLKQPWELPGS